MPADPATTTSAQGDTVGHPLLWNPLRRGAFERGTPPAANVAGQYPLADLKLTAARYSTKATDIQNQTFLGELARPFNAASRQTFSLSGPAGVDEQDNVNRALTTPLSNSQQSAALGVNFANTAARTLTITTPGTPGFPPFPTLGATPPTFSVTLGAADGGSDTFDGAGSNQQVVNRQARLGPLDLNRPLTDYPVDQTAGSPTFGKLTNAAALANPGAVFQADNDRQRFAHDIFIRLALASGGAVVYDTTNQRHVVDPGVLFADPRYDALRWLAQYAANVVDAIDGDDVNFAFVWNPFDINNPRDGSNFADPSNRLVFGVEKPRLVLNEVYAEVANSEQDAMGPRATRPFEARFFAELLNPGKTLIGPSGTPLDSSIVPNNVPLTVDGTQPAYRIEVYDDSTQVRNQLGAGVAATQQTMGNVMGSVNVPTGANYRRRINMAFDNTVQMNLTPAETVTDAFGSPVFDPARNVEPNDGISQSTGLPLRAGFALIGPGSRNGSNTKITTNAAAYAPDVATGPTKLMIQKPYVAAPPTVNPTAADANAMAYFLPLAKNSEITTDTNTHAVTRVGSVGATPANPIRPHAMLLRRLANPYLPESPTNPFLTVDAVYDIRLFDALSFVESASGNAPAQRTPTQNATDHRSIGRTQPYAGFMSTVTTAPGSPPAIPDPYFADTRRSAEFTGAANPPANANLTLRQKTLVTTPGGMSQTFMSHNFDLDSSATTGFTVAAPVPNGLPPQQQPVPPNPINPNANDNRADRNMQYPFTWLPHFDRPLINQEELLHVAAVKPHELTFEFARPGAKGPPTTDGRAEAPAADNLHTLTRWVTPSSSVYNGYTTVGNATALIRALDFLQVNPRVHDTPLGGRVAGKLNVNMIWDKKVFQALLDRNAGSKFTDTEVEAMWQQFTASRTPNYPATGNTNDEVAAGGTPNDRPFKSFGVPTFAAGGNRVSPSSLDDTLLRAVTPAGSAGPQLLFSSPSQTHPYARTEPLRKILNNVTTTTDTFLLIYTVSYFEVRNPIAANQQYYPAPGGVPVVLGKEVFKDVPGDLRAQFYAVIDRSNLTVPETPRVPAAATDAASEYAALSASPEGGLWVIETASDLVDADPASPNPTGVDPNNFSRVFSVQVNLFSQPTATNPVVPGPGTPSYGPNELPSQPSAIGSYATRDEDRDPARNFTIVPGSVFAVGTGRQRLTLQALPGQWTYDPLSGRTRILVRVYQPPATVPPASPAVEEPFDAAIRNYPAGTMLSNARFGARFAQPAGGVAYPATALDPKKPSPQVPAFGRLQPQ